MLWKKTIYILLMFFLSYTTHPQSTFAKSIKNSNNREGIITDHIQTYDGKIVSIGALWPITNTSLLPLFLMKFDTSGNILFKKRINPLQFGEPKIIQTQDSGYLIGVLNGFGSFGLRDICIIKLDASFNIQWSKLIGTIHADEFSEVLQTKDRGYIIAGSIAYIDSGGSDIYVIKLDSTGNIEWTKTYGGPNSDGAADIVASDNNTYVVLGSTYSYGAGGLDIYLLKIDSVGNLLWTKTIGGPADEWASSMIKDKNHLIIQGSTTSYTFNTNPIPYYILKIPEDSISNVKWAKIINSYSGFPALYDLTINKKGEYVGAFYFYFISPYDSMRGYLLNIDSAGNINWLYRHSVYNIYYSPITQMADSSYIATGGYNINNCSIDCANLIVKFDKYGRTCLPQVPVPYADAGAIIGNGGTITSVNQGSVTNFYPTMSDDGIDSTLCSCPDIPVQIQRMPVNCYTNGSATITPVSPGNYTYYWNPPVSSTNTGTNLSEGSYTVTIMDSTGCQKTIIFSITKDLTLPISITGNTLLCSGQSSTLSVQGVDACTWSTGETELSIIVQPTATTTYTLVGTGGICTQTADVTVSVLPTPSVSITPTSAVINAGDTVYIQANGAVYYSWYPVTGINNPNIASPLLNPTVSTIYCVTGKDSSNTCVDTACISIDIKGTCFDIRVPNIFTPNADNVNDEWGIEFPCPQLVSDFSLSIFNRWGVKLFESSKVNSRWNAYTISGERVPTGTYYYVAEFKINNKKQTVKGYFTLLR